MSLKKFKNNIKKMDISYYEPKTVMESIESLEEFLIADFGQPWSVEFLKTHFNICKKEIRKILKNQGVK